MGLNDALVNLNEQLRRNIQYGQTLQPQLGVESVGNMMDLYEKVAGEDQGEKQFLVLNESAAISGLMFQQDAETFAKRVIAGKIPNLAGVDTCYVVKCVPVARIRDRALYDNVAVDKPGDVDATATEVKE